MDWRIKKIRIAELIYLVCFVLLIISLTLPYYYVKYFPEIYFDRYYFVKGLFIFIFAGYLGIPAFTVLFTPIILIHKLKIKKAVKIGIIGCGLVSILLYLSPIFANLLDGDIVGFSEGFYFGTITLILILVTNLVLIKFKEIDLENIVSNNITKLRSAYNQISIEELAHQIGISLKTVGGIIESMIYNKQWKDQISKGIIIFRNVRSMPTQPPIYQIKEKHDLQGKKGVRRGLKVFLSYSTSDTDYFHISDIAKFLEYYPEIERVLYWEADSGVNIVEYMEKTLKDCNVFVLFCTENSLNSRAVTDEWQAAFQLRKKDLLKILPVYEDERFIPALLTPLLNVKFLKNNFNDFTTKLYQELLRE